MRYLVLFTFLLLSLFTNLKANTSDSFTLDYPSVHYTTKDGLPSNETFCVFQDSRGYIWIGTDRGLVKFDGYDFKTYTTIDGLIDNVILAINEDNKGNLWYTGLNSSKLGYIDPQMNFHTYIYSDHIAEELNMLEFPRARFNEIYIEGSDLYLVNNRYGYLVVNDKGIKNVNIRANGINDNTDIFIVNRADWNFTYSYYIYTKRGAKFLKNKQVTIYNREKQNVFVYTKEDFNNIYPRLISQDNKDYIYNGFDQFIISGNHVDYSPLELKCTAFKLDEGQFIFSTFGENDKSPTIFYSTFPDINKEKVKLSIGGRVNCAIKDSKGGVWISTLRKGLIYIPRLNTKKSSNEEAIEAMFPFHDSVLIESKSQRYLYQYPLNTADRKSTYPRIDCSVLKESGGKHSFYSQIQVKTDGRLKEYFDQHHATKGVQVLSESLVYLWSNGYIFRYKCIDGLVETDWSKLRHDLSRQESLYCFREDSCVYGTSKGLMLYSGDSLVELNIGKDRTIKHIEYFQSSGLLAYTLLGEGLIVRNQLGEEKQLTIEHGLASNTINSVYMDKQEVLWLGTNCGVNTLSIDAEGKWSLKTVIKGDKSLSSPNILQIYYKDSVLYLGTDAGFNLVDFKLDQSEYQNEIPLYLKEIEINNIIYSHPNKPFKLDYNQNNITFSYTALAFNMYGGINYRYMLKGLSEEWVYTKERKASFLQLNPGQYSFVLEVQDESGHWKVLDYSQIITIDKPYWQTWWFIGCVIFVIICIIGTILYYYISNLKKEKHYIENERILSEELNESRQMALSAQLNPHFVFNALNSIQNFILTKRTELSSDYLSMFSKLMRFVFENSKKLYVSLSDEIEALKLYLELEKVRHNHRFKYVINVDENLPIENKFIPSLLIQPMIENAIWHGLLHKEEGECLLEIEFKLNGDFLEIIVQDNGVGRAKTKPRPKFIKKQKSSGVELTKQRLLLLYQSTGLKTKFTIHDLFDKDMQPNGTRVTISIPNNLDA